MFKKGDIIRAREDCPIGITHAKSGHKFVVVSEHRIDCVGSGSGCIEGWFCTNQEELFVLYKKPIFVIKGQYGKK